MKKRILNLSLTLGLFLSIAGTAWAGSSSNLNGNLIDFIQTVPDAGSSALLLGIAVVALGLARKFRH